jgi:dihydroorotate dehydrogenase (fumarate)
MLPSFATSLAGIQLESCLMNASGVHCSLGNQLDDLRHSAAGALVTKSCTLEYRQGNPEPRYASIPYGSINSMGLPNQGIQYYLEYISKEQPGTQKPIVLSIAGLSRSENLELLKLASACAELQLIELNLSCPNVPGKPQTAYDFDETHILLEQAFAVCSKPVGVKLPPYFDIAHFEGMAEILRSFPLAFVNCVNSLGNGLWLDTETETVSIKPKAGFGGVGGLYIKPTALANVRMFSKLLPELDIIGCGGVQTGEDAFQHILCGASVVQVGTCLWEEGPACFTRISAELSAIMQQKGYHNINEFKGKVKER